MDQNWRDEARKSLGNILYDHPKEEKKSSSSHKRDILIAISPSLQSQGLAIKPKPSMSWKPLREEEIQPFVDDEFGKIVNLQASQETSEHAISLWR
jgi:hypothetical protein